MGQRFQPSARGDRRRQMQAALGEKRNHPPAHHGDDGPDQPQRRPHRPSQQREIPRRQRVQRHGVDQRQQQQQADQRIVAALPDAPELPAQARRHHRQEGQFQRHQHRPRQPRPQPADPRRQPQREQCRQRPAAQAGRAGPGLHGGQQETGNHCRHEAKRHLVHVPGQPAAARRKAGHQAQIGRGPQRHREQRESGAAQKERPKAQSPQRRRCGWLRLHAAGHRCLRRCPPCQHQARGGLIVSAPLRPLAAPPPGRRTPSASAPPARQVHPAGA